MPLPSSVCIVALCLLIYRSESSLAMIVRPSCAAAGDRRPSAKYCFLFAAQKLRSPISSSDTTSCNTMPPPAWGSYFYILDKSHKIKKRKVQILMLIISSAVSTGGIAIGQRLYKMLTKMGKNGYKSAISMIKWVKSIDAPLRNIVPPPMSGASSVSEQISSIPGKKCSGGWGPAAGVQVRGAAERRATVR